MAILDIQIRQDSAWRTLTSHNFPVLSKKTWSDWVWHTHTALKSGGVFQAVLGIDPATGQRYAPPHQNAALPFYDQAANDAWTSAMTSAADWIAQAAGPKHANEVARFLNRNDPRGMWDHLEQLYAAPNTTSCYNAFARLVDEPIKPDDTWETFLLHSKDLASNTLKLRPPNFTPEDFIDMALAHRIIKRVVTGHPLHTMLVTGQAITGDVVHDSVLRYLNAEPNLPMERADAPALVAALASSNPKPAKPKCDFCYYKGHTIEACHSMIRARDEFHAKKKNGGNHNKQSNNNYGEKAKVAAATEDNIDNLPVETAGNEPRLI